MDNPYNNYCPCDTELSADMNDFNSFWLCHAALSSDRRLEITPDKKLLCNTMMNAFVQCTRSSELLHANKADAVRAVYSLLSENRYSEFRTRWIDTVNGTVLGLVGFDENKKKSVDFPSAYFVLDCLADFSLLYLYDKYGNWHEGFTATHDTSKGNELLFYCVTRGRLLLLEHLHKAGLRIKDTEDLRQQCIKAMYRNKQWHMRSFLVDTLGWIEDEQLNKQTIKTRLLLDGGITSFKVWRLWRDADCQRPEVLRMRAFSDVEHMYYLQDPANHSVKQYVSRSEKWFLPSNAFCQDIVLYCLITGRVRLLSQLIQFRLSAHLHTENLLKNDEKRSLFSAIIVNKQWHAVHYIRKHFDNDFLRYELPELDFPVEDLAYEDRVAAYARRHDPDSLKTVLTLKRCENSLKSIKFQHEHLKFSLGDALNQVSLVMYCCESGRLELLKWIYTCLCINLHEVTASVGLGVLETVIEKHNNWHIASWMLRRLDSFPCFDSGYVEARMRESLPGCTSEISLSTLEDGIALLKDPDSDISDYDWESVIKKTIMITSLRDIVCCDKLLFPEDEQEIDLVFYCIESGRLNLLHWVLTTSSLTQLQLMELHSEKLVNTIFNFQQWHIQIYFQCFGDFMQSYDTDSAIASLCGLSEVEVSSMERCELGKLYQRKKDTDADFEFAIRTTWNLFVAPENAHITQGPAYAAAAANKRQQ